MDYGKGWWSRLARCYWVNSTSTFYTWPVASLRTTHYYLTLAIEYDRFVDLSLGSYSTHVAIMFDWVPLTYISVLTIHNILSNIVMSLFHSLQNFHWLYWINDLEFPHMGQHHIGAFYSAWITLSSSFLTSFTVNRPNILGLILHILEKLALPLWLARSYFPTV